MRGPLEQLTILELPGGVATRYCGRLFAELGATVLAAGARPDDAVIGYGGDAGRSYGRWLDERKVLVGEGSPATAVDLVIAGQDHETVERAAATHRTASLLALTWFAEDGPYAAWCGTDEVILALTGLAYGFGEPDGPPMPAQGHGPQLCAGLTAFNAALAALLWPVTRRPRKVSVNIFEAAMCFTETGAVSASVDGMASARLGVNRFVPTYPCSSYRTADGWLGVTALTPGQWQALTHLLGRPDLAGEPRFATAYERLMLGDEVDAILAPLFAERQTAAWVALGDAHRIPMAPMLRPGELPNAPHWQARESFRAFDETVVQGPGIPFRMDWDGAAQRFEPQDGPGPLAGLKVVDFSMGWAGPLCTRTLGDLGAEVVKVESVSHPDWWRGWEVIPDADPPPTELRANFCAVNRNKLGVALELGAPEGLAAARALIGEADVVVENFAAGVMRKLGLDFAAQRALRPGLISVSMAAFGASGPLSGLRAYGSTVEQASGLPFMNGEAHWPPCLQHVAYGDPLAGLFAAAAVLSALHGRGRLGGADVDLAQVACLFQFAADGILAEQVTGAPVPRTGPKRARAEVSVVRGAGEDAWLLVCLDSSAARRGLLHTLAGATLADWAASRAPAEAASALQAAGVPAAPVQPTHALAVDPQLLASGFWTFLDRRYIGWHMIGEAPVSYDGVRPPLRRPAPTLGEHTGEVVRALGRPI